MVHHTYVCTDISAVIVERELTLVHNCVLSAPVIFFFNWKLCFHIYKCPFHLIKKMNFMYEVDVFYMSIM